MYLVGRTRIHLDRVDGLGDFIELEVLLGQDDDEVGGEKEAHDMFARLGVAESDLVPVAYVDLLGSKPRLRRQRLRQPHPTRWPSGSGPLRLKVVSTIFERTLSTPGTRISFFITNVDSAFRSGATMRSR